jgi:hypothetical protein
MIQQQLSIVLSIQNFIQCGTMTQQEISRLQIFQQHLSFTANSNQSEESLDLLVKQFVISIGDRIFQAYHPESQLIRVTY